MRGHPNQEVIDSSQGSGNHLIWLTLNLELNRKVIGCPNQEIMDSNQSNENHWTCGFLPKNLMAKWETVQLEKSCNLAWKTYIVRSISYNWFDRLLIKNLITKWDAVPIKKSWILATAMEIIWFDWLLINNLIAKWEAVHSQRNRNRWIWLTFA